MRYNGKQCSAVVLILSVFIGACSESSGNGLRTARSDLQTGENSSGDSGVYFGYVTPTDPRYDITLSEIRDAVQNGTAVFIDARGPLDYAGGHIRDAINIPAGAKESYLSKLRESVAPDQFIIIYCNGPYCESSDMIYEYLAAQGYTNMKVFKPGWRTLGPEKDLR